MPGNLLGDLLVRIVGDNAEFDTAIDKSQKKFVKFEKSALKIGKNLTKFVTLPILGIGLASIKAASDAEETAALFGTVFRDISDDAAAMAKDLQENYLLSRQESQKLLGSTGDLLTGFGFTQEAALDLSGQVNRLAADLASFRNIEGGAARASEALTKALLGESEQAKALGIVIRQDSKEYIELVKHFMEAEGATLLQAKALTALKISLDQSKNAIGDIDRTQESAANRMRETTNAIKDLAVTLGNDFLPVAVDVLEGITALARRLDDMDDGTRKVVVSVALAAAAIGPLLIALSKTITAVRILRAAFIALNTTMKLSIVGGAIAIITGLVIAVSALSKRQKDLAEETREAADEQARLTEEWKRYQAAIKGETLDAQLFTFQAGIISLRVEMAKAVRKAQELADAGKDNNAFLGVAVLKQKQIVDLYQSALGVATEQLEIAKAAVEIDSDKVQDAIDFNAAVRRELKIRGDITDAEQTQIDLLKQQFPILVELRAEWKELERLMTFEAARAKAVPNIEEEIRKINQLVELATKGGEEINAVEEKREAVLDEINKLIDAGADIEDDAITNILEKYGDLLDAYEDQVELLEMLEEAKERGAEADAKAMQAAQELAAQEVADFDTRVGFHLARLSQQKQELAAIERERIAFIKAGVSKKEANDWATGEINRINQQYHDAEVQRIEDVEAADAALAKSLVATAKSTAEEFERTVSAFSDSIDQIKAVSVGWIDFFASLQDAARVQQWQNERANNERMLDDRLDAIDEAERAALASAGLLDKTREERAAEALVSIQERLSGELSATERAALEEERIEAEKAVRKTEIEQEAADARVLARETAAIEERRINLAVAEFNRDIAVAEATINKESAISDIGFGIGSRGKKAETAALYDSLIALIQATPLPALAHGGIIPPRPGGTKVIAAEAGVPEVFFPLDKLGSVLAQLPGPGGESGGSEEMMRVIVNLDGQPILDTVAKATRNRTLLIDAGSVV